MPLASPWPLVNMVVKKKMKIAMKTPAAPSHTRQFQDSPTAIVTAANGTIASAARMIPCGE